LQLFAALMDDWRDWSTAGQERMVLGDSSPKVGNSMAAFLRNLGIAFAALFAATLLTLIAQGAFEFALPALRERSIGLLPISTCIALAVFTGSFLAVGMYAPRWLRTSAPLLWLLLPIAVLYVVAIIRQPYVFFCSPFGKDYGMPCWMVLTPFVVSSSALIIGYLVVGRLGR
jgi:predicted small integral membrane protein